MVEIIDISAEQPCGECARCKKDKLVPAIEWDKLDPAIVMVIVKASEGIDYEDPCFRNHCAGARSAGRILAAYHYLRIRHGAPQDSALQAAQFVALLARESVDVAVLDAETEFNEAATPEEALDAIHIFMANAVTFGAFLMLYTSPGEWGGWKLSTASEFAAFALWVADYAITVKVPAPWVKWLLWQYTGSGKVDGIAGAVDRSRFAGTLDELHAAILPP